ncbi:thiol peroxidase, partial [candidate division KSB1 bacterium]
NKDASDLDNTVVLCISVDLPFAHQRFCETEGIENVVTLSDLRKRDFGENYGVRIADGPIAGVFSRAIVILDENGIVVYKEQVPEIAQEPDYDAALNAL